MIKLKNILREAGLLSEQTEVQIGDTSKLEFGPGRYKAEEIQDQFEKIAKKIETYQQQGNKVTGISIDASESQVSNIDAYTKEKLELGKLGELRKTAAKEWFEKRFPNLKITVTPETKIGSVPWPDYNTRKTMTEPEIEKLAQDPKYTQDQWVRVAAIGEPKTKELDFSQYILIYTTYTGWGNHSIDMINKKINIYPRIGWVDQSKYDEFIAVVPNPAALESIPRISGNKIEINKTTLPLFAKAFNVKTTDEVIRLLGGNKSKN